MRKIGVEKPFGFGGEVGRTTVSRWIPPQQDMFGPIPETAKGEVSFLLEEKLKPKGQFLTWGNMDAGVEGQDFYSRI